MALAATPAHSAIILRGDFQHGSTVINGTSTPTLEITEDITFTVTVGGQLRTLIFRQWTTSDGSANATGLDPLSQNLSYKINGGSTMTIPLNQLVDNAASIAANDQSADDGYLVFQNITVNQGDTVTILADTYTFSPNSGFNPALNGTTFEDQVFLATVNGGRLSSNTAVPEPSAAALCLLGLAGFLRRKRQA